jgi:DNA-binding NarL/FixJ family response regulator
MKILLADDHVLFREGVRYVLEQSVPDEAWIVEAGDYPQAIASLRADPSFEVALVDLNMPGMDGIAGIKALKRLSSSLKLIVISASEAEGDIRRALEAGASGFIGKSSSSAAMVQGIFRVMGGETYLSPWVDMSVAAPSQAGATVWRWALTPRQRDVLAMLRQGKSNKEIARDLDLAEITVKLHVTAILRALGVENRTQAAIVASRGGVA